MIVHLAVRSRFDAGQSIKVQLGAFFPSLKLHAPQNRGRRHRCTWKNEDTDMPINLHGRNVLALDDFSGADIRHLLRLAADLKAAKRAGAETRIVLAPGGNAFLRRREHVIRTVLKGWE